MKPPLIACVAQLVTPGPPAGMTRDFAPIGMASANL